MKAFSVVDFSTSFFKVHFSMKLMYRTLPYDEEEDVQTGDSEVKDSSTSDDNVRIKIQWDDDCPWTEWYSAEDPLRSKCSILLLFSTLSGTIKL